RRPAAPSSAAGGSHAPVRRQRSCRADGGSVTPRWRASAASSSPVVCPGSASTATSRSAWPRDSTTRRSSTAAELRATPGPDRRPDEGQSAEAPAPLAEAPVGPVPQDERLAGAAAGGGHLTHRDVVVPGLDQLAQLALEPGHAAADDRQAGRAQV